MVRIASVSVVAATLLAAATISTCATIPRHLVSREVAATEATGISTREMLDHLELPRAEVEEIFERSYDEVVDMDAREMLQELYAREPNKVKNFFKRIGRGIKKAAGKVFNVVKGIAGAVLGRDVSDADLEARELFDEVMEVIERDYELSQRSVLEEVDMVERYFEERGFRGELYERAFLEDNLLERDLYEDEVEAREFGYDLD